MTDTSASDRGGAAPGAATPWSAARRALALRLLGEQGFDLGRLQIMPRDRAKDPCPLSFAQERLWFLHRLQPDSPAYNITLTLPLAAPVPTEILDRAYRELLERHDALRTTFPAVDGTPVQQVAPSAEFVIPVVDLRSLAEAERTARITQIVGTERLRPFDLALGPVIRPLLIHLDQTVSVFVLCVHHIVVDGWSGDLLARDFNALYYAALHDEPSPLPKLPVQYGDFAVWQRNAQANEALDSHLAFWKAKLADLPALRLPTDRPRPPQMTYDGAGEETWLSSAATEALKELSRREGATLYLTLLAAFNVLLARYSGQSDIVLGTPVANRERVELASVIGFFLNMVVVRTDLSAARTLRDVLRQTRSTVREAFEHQDMPFEKLVSAVGAGGDPGRNPLFEVTFTLEPTPQFLAPAARPSPTQTGADQSARFDLEVSVRAEADGLRLGFIYRKDLFQASTVRRMLEHYAMVLETFTRDLDVALAEVPIAPEATLTTVEFLSQLRSLDIKLALDGDRLRINAAPGAVTAALREELTRRKGEIIDLLRAAAPRAGTAIQPVDRKRPLPISLAQQRLWFLHQLDPRSAVYNIAVGLSLKHALDIDAMSRAIDEVTRRHESLRTRFPTQDGSPTVEIVPFSPGRLEVVDLRFLAPAEREQQQGRLLAAVMHEPFDLARGPLFRARLIRLQEDEYVLGVCMHHIVSDGWSMRVLSSELSALYTAFANRRPDPLPALPLQFVDYAQWQRDRLDRDGLAGQLQYWTNQLRGRLPVLQLPTDRPRPPVQTFNGRRVRCEIPPALATALKELSLKEGASLFMTLLAAFEILLHRYTGDADIIVGSPTAGRSRPELESLIGFFVNNLVLRTDLSGNPSFRELLGRVRRTFLNAHANQEVPFDRLVEVLRPERDVSHAPLFQVLFNSPTTPITGLDDTDSRVQALEFEIGVARFDLTVEYYEGSASAETGDIARWKSGGIRFYWEYNTDLFDSETIARMQGHYLRVLESIVANPGEQLAAVALLSPEEIHQQLRGWNGTQRAYDDRQPVHRLFEERVRVAPDTVAVVTDTEELTYRELDRRANRMARHLRRHGVESEALVGVCLERSAAMVVTVLAVLKSGGAYVPLDPRYPAERLRYMMEDAGIGVLVTEDQLKDRLPHHGAHTIFVDRDAESIAGESTDALDTPIGKNHRAYVIYTSGSTGKPKGVEVEHGAIVNFLAAMREEPGLTSADRLLSVTTLSFDIAGLELYLPLTTGARVIVASSAAAADASQLMELISRSEATVMQATPATWRLLIESGWSGNPRLKALCGGEALPRDLADQLLPRVGELWNLYGPTEATIWCTIHRVGPGTGSVSIGRPIANMQAYVLGPSLQPVPVGVTGELFLGGVGLARGYLKRPELTAERFVRNPLGSAPGSRLYRTGDLARLHADGTIEWLGRADGQTKIRGFRIELGEIETALTEIPGVRQAVVTVREASAGDQRLAAYLVSAKNSAVDTSAISLTLRKRLPDYMVPSTYIVLDSFPVTPNGKVDRRALPAPDSPAGERAGFVAPGSDMEHLVASLWSEILGIETIGLHDNFFDLGGHSLLVVRVHSRLEKQVPNPPSLVDLFQYPTVGALADRLVRGTTAKTFDQARERAQRQLQA